VYGLGVDLGTTFTAAAVWRGGRAEICPLGTRAAEIPSVVLARPDGSFLTGEAAARRATVDPDRVAREFKRRLGDSTPLLLGGSPFSAVALTARLLSAVVGTVSSREGGPPSSVCVSHPANWGPYKTDLLKQAVTLADLRVPVTFTTEPEAAAGSYARQERLSVGDTVAVYDLGGGTFDAAVLRRTARGFEILGQPEGIERLGGIDIDAAVFNHVVRSVGEALTELDEDDPAAIAAVARLRAECTEAKEALSSDTDVTIPVILPTTSTEVRLTRAELEDMVRPSLYDSIESLKRAVRSADVEVDDVTAVLLVGGSSRMPLVSQLVGSELGRPVAVDTHPKHAIALGAAWTASGAAGPDDSGGAGGFAAAPLPAPRPAPVRAPHTPLPPGPPVSQRPAPGAAPPTTPAGAPVGAAAFPAAPPPSTMPPANRPPANLPPANLAPANRPPANLPPPPGAAPSTMPPGHAPYGTTPRTPAPATAALGGGTSSGLGLPPGARPAMPAPTGSLPPPPAYLSQPGAFPAQGRPPSTSGAGRGVMLAVLAVLVLLAAGGGYYAYSRTSSPTDVPVQGGGAASGGASASGAGRTPAAPGQSPAAGGAASTSGGGAAPAPAAGSKTQNQTVQLTVAVQGPGLVSGAGAACDGTCTATVNRGRTVQLHAEPAGDAAFVRWSNCPRPSGQECSVTANGSTTVTALFEATGGGRTTAPPTRNTTEPPPSTTSTSAPPPTTTSAPPPTTTSAPPPPPTTAPATGGGGGAATASPSAT
jgi:molecular chaperone DnaK